MWRVGVLLVHFLWKLGAATQALEQWVGLAWNKKETDMLQLHRTVLGSRRAVASLGCVCFCSTVMGAVPIATVAQQLCNILEHQFFRVRVIAMVQLDRLKAVGMSSQPCNF